MALSDIWHDCSGTLSVDLCTLMNLSEQSPPRLIIPRRCDLVRVVLVVHVKHIITDFDRSDTTDIAMAIDVLERLKVELLLLQNAIVA